MAGQIEVEADRGRQIEVEVEASRQVEVEAGRGVSAGRVEIVVCYTFNASPQGG